MPTGYLGELSYAEALIITIGVFGDRYLHQQSNPKVHPHFPVMKGFQITVSIR